MTGILSVGYRTACLRLNDTLATRSSKADSPSVTDEIIASDLSADAQRRPVSGHLFAPAYFRAGEIFATTLGNAPVADASREGSCIGMALFKQGWESQYYGNPPIFSLGCVGRMTHIVFLDEPLQPAQDGRSNLILQGLYRYTIQEEYFDARYRKARSGQITLGPSAGYSVSNDCQSSLYHRGSMTLTALATRRYLQSRKADKLCELVTDEAMTDRVLASQRALLVPGLDIRNSAGKTVPARSRKPAPTNPPLDRLPEVQTRR